MGPPVYSPSSRSNHGYSAAYDPLSTSKHGPTASLRSPIRRRGSSGSSSGSSSAAATIVSRRYSSLREAIAECEPGEPFSVEGNAPSPITHADVYARLRRELRTGPRSDGATSGSRPGRPRGDLVRLSIPELHRLERRGTFGLDLGRTGSAARFSARPLSDDESDESGATPQARDRSTDDEMPDRTPVEARDSENQPIVDDHPRALRRMPRGTYRRYYARAHDSTPWLSAGPADGLGDRRRSPSIADEPDWETLRASIPPDGRLPSASASSSFASSAAVSAATQQTTRESSISTAPSALNSSQQHSFLTRLAAARARISGNLEYSHFPSNAASHFADGAPPPPWDITQDQLARGVLCDDANDTVPAFTPSLGPLRHMPGRNGSPDQEFFEISGPNGGPRYRVSSALAARARTLPPLANSVGRGQPSSRPAQPSEPRSSGADTPRPFRRSSSTDPAHLRAPDEPEPRQRAGESASPSVEQLQPVADHLLNVPGSEDMRRYQTQTEPRPSPPTATSDDADAPWHRRRSMARVDARLAAVREQHNQLRRINELLQCDREVPAHLWELVGLGPDELGVDVFDI